MKKKLTKGEKKEARQQKKSQRKMMFNKMSKSRDQEIKKEKKRLNKEKPRKPKGYRSRQFGAVVFWILFSFMFLVVSVTILSQPSSSANGQPKKIVEKKENPSMKPGAIQFAKDFASVYFTWDTTQEAKDIRKRRLEKFLAKGLDPQAGLNISSIESKSVFNGATINRVKDKGHDKAYITMRVVYQLSKNVEKKVEVKPEKNADQKKKEGEETKESKKDPSKAEPKTKTVTVTQTKSVSKYFVVPVAYNGTFGIYELPKFTYIDGQTSLHALEDNGLKEINDKQVVDNVNNFLSTFFKSYAEAPRDQLVYVLEDKDHLNGLKQTMSFVKVDEAGIYQGNKKNHYIVQCKVMFEDPESKAQFTTDYHLVVEKQNERYVVTSINNNERGE